MAKGRKNQAEPEPRVTFTYNEGITMSGRKFTLSDFTKLIDEAHDRGFAEESIVTCAMYSQARGAFALSGMKDEIRVSAKTETLDLDGSPER